MGSCRRMECCHISPQTLLERSSVVYVRQAISEGNPPQFVVQVRQLLLALGQVRLELLDAEERVHPRFELGEVDRLGDVVVGAGVQSLDLVLGGVQRGLHDHRNERKLFAFSLCLEAAHDFHAVHLRHHHVEEDQPSAHGRADGHISMSGRSMRSSARSSNITGRSSLLVTTFILSAPSPQVFCT